LDALADGVRQAWPRRLAAQTRQILEVLADGAADGALLEVTLDGLAIGAFQLPVVVLAESPVEALTVAHTFVPVK
jgi:hypothetical protein